MLRYHRWTEGRGGALRRRVQESGPWVLCQPCWVQEWETFEGKGFDHLSLKPRHLIIARGVLEGLTGNELEEPVVLGQHKIPGQILQELRRAAHASILGASAGQGGSGPSVKVSRVF